MTDELLLISIGPVQGFIAQARRTRDLWFGSHLLSELARAGARCLAERGAELIFPALEPGDPELQPCDALLRDSCKPPLPIANKLLALTPDGSACALAAEQAVRERWRKLSESARRRAEEAKLLAPNVEWAWNEQIEAFLETAAVWERVGDDYGKTVAELDRVLGAIKAARPFAQWRHQPPGAPKSSLDGERPSLLARARNDGTLQAGRARYRIARGEQLDAIGLTKRLAGDPGQFLPIANVAAASWLRRLRSSHQDELERLSEAAKRLNLPQVTPLNAAGHLWSWDASFLYLWRLDSAFEELAASPGASADDTRARSDYQDKLKALCRRAGNPHSYVACLIADGDRMGELVSTIETPDQHKALSHALSDFARKALEVVDGHLGLPVYGGGDDVLCLVSVERAIPCAAALQTAFAQALAEFAGDSWHPSLSVGIGIAHMLEAMGDLIGLAREAERLAKEGRGAGGLHGTAASPSSPDAAKGSAERNALAVILQKRSGGRISWRSNWQDEPLEQLKKADQLLSGSLSTAVLYSLSKTIDLLGERATDSPDLALALRGEMVRRLQHSGFSQFELVPPQLLRPSGGADELVRETRRWVDTLRLALNLDRARPAAELEQPA